jgi:hypothetical protein
MAMTAMTSEEADEVGVRMHESNLALVTKYLRRKGLWRIRLNAVCDIVEIVNATKGGPPQAGEISMRVVDGELPTWGTRDRLSVVQDRYVAALQGDCRKVCSAKQLAHADHEATHSSALGDQHLQEMRSVVGELPMSKLECEAEVRQQEQAEAARQARERAADEQEVSEVFRDVSLEGEMRRAQKRADKRARQKQRKREAQSTAATQ